MRALTRVIVIAAALAAICTAAVAASAPAVAARVRPGATLTAGEYRQLSAEQAAFRKLLHRPGLTWNDVYAACAKVGRSTALLRSVRVNCDTGVGIEQSLAGFYVDLQRCTALSDNTPGTGTTTTGTGTTTTGTGTSTPGTGTSTTGTTTTPGITTTGTTTTPGTTTAGTTTTGTTTTPGTLSPTELKLLACLQPEYSVIGRAAASVYAAQAALRRQVLARGFVGRCRLTLAPTPPQLRLLRRFVATSRELAADVALISRVAAGRAPASDINQAQIERDSVAFSAAGRAFSRIHRPQKLSVCPHQG